MFVCLRIRVRLEFIFTSLENHTGDPMQISLRFCTFPQVLLQRNEQSSLQGCGKSCEFEYQVIAGLEEIPLWIAVQADSFQQYFFFDCKELVSDLKLLSIDIPFRNFSLPSADRKTCFLCKMRFMHSSRSNSACFIAKIKNESALQDLPVQPVLASPRKKRGPGMLRSL